MERKEAEPRIGTGYPFAELARAFVTAVTHEDEATRERAERRAEKWTAVLQGMVSGRLRIGSRTPVAGLPAWVTPEVVRGGFATGKAAAGDRRRAHLRERFEESLTEPGLTELHELLRTRAYAVEIPEHAALLTVAWLVGAGDQTAALALAETLRPYGDRLRFTPVRAEPRTTDESVVWRATAGATADALRKRKPNPRVAAMREALTVWNPFADELLALWLETEGDGGVATVFPPGWHARGRALLDRYEKLAAEHTHCTKHRKPKENLAILRAALEDVVAGRKPAPRRLGLLRHAVASMVARRGAPGSPEHRALRTDQAAQAAAPMHHGLAAVVASRVAELPPKRGIDAIDPLLAPVAGTPIPPSIAAVVERALAAPPETLIERGIVPSAEVLAELVPPIAGATIARAYEEETLRSLMAANYAAFRRRRSLLLLNLEHQVRIEELPWVQAVAQHRSSAQPEALAALVRLTELAIGAFPGTILPSALLTELDALGREAEVELPLVEELAADIFMGTFSAKFLAAAKLAGRLLAGSTYERYYGIDYAEVLAIDDVARRRPHAAPTSATFDALCRRRAGDPTDSPWSVAGNGTIIEQAQILTTHNLAALTGPFGVGDAIRVDWTDLARGALERAAVLAGRLEGNPRPLGMVKDVAYAWRQMVFFLSRLERAEQAAFVSWAQDRAAPRLEPAVAGLEHVVAGGTFDEDAPGRRLLGWTLGPHWILTGVRR